MIHLANTPLEIIFVSSAFRITYPPNSCLFMSAMPSTIFGSCPMMICARCIYSLLNCDNRDQTRKLIGAWITDYNTARPHSSLGYKTPAAYAGTLTAPKGVTLAEALIAAG